MYDVETLWVIVHGDHGQYKSSQRINWPVVTVIEMSQKKCYITSHEAVLHNMVSRPSLAETQIGVEVKRLKCVKYELGEISSSVDNLIIFYWPIGWNAHNS